ncbi:hypothetical protein T11_172 [Trichinella zimbabwensis]|uniref:Uncharacterized protein n=1 Tax=Trichinella zimbabwensis TaxID=268475 RepID=A0A0V1HK05_9BILA|nr:hypothetical protein T11_172 [Trichinella zimbabwensis]
MDCAYISVANVVKLKLINLAIFRMINNSCVNIWNNRTMQKNTLYKITQAQCVHVISCQQKQMLKHLLCMFCIFCEQNDVKDI